MADIASKSRLRETIASEIRVAMLRRQITGAELARALGKSEAYVSRRLSGGTAFDVDDLEIIAAALRVTVTDLVGHAERGDGSYVRDVSVGDDGASVIIPAQFTPSEPVMSVGSREPASWRPVVATAIPIQRRASVVAR